jgi:prepilin-type processing-associated H-X9-DG protein
MVNKGRKMGEFVDGTSKTAAVSEIRNIQGEDTRGVLHFGAGVLYMHDFPPNYAPNPPVRESTRYCVSVDYAPCLASPQQWAGSWRHFARSSHSGGVNLLMVDSSTHFITDSISIEAWQALSTPRGGEVHVEGI